jgi:Fur family peroxide stress response transcriptional regulator
MEKYRHIGFKLTPQRIAILDYLEGNKDHPSADDIYKTVSKKFTTMSIATVYTTLAALKERGAVLELTVDPDKKRYDPTTESHGHLICISCKRIVDIPGEHQLELSESAKQNFTVLKSHLEVHGYCPACNNKNLTVAKEAVNVRRS